jgi:cell division protein FtsW
MSAATLAIAWRPSRAGADGGLLLASVALVTWGLVMVASASVAPAERLTGNTFHFLFKQLQFVAIGGAAAYLAYLIPLRFWANKGFLLLLAAMALLVLVLIPGIGVTVNSSQRWIDTPLFRIQASEPARLALVMYLAGYLVRQQAAVQTRLLGTLRPLLVLLLPGVLLLAQPDFGAFAVLMAVAFLMLFLAGAPLRYFLALLVLAAIGLGLVATLEEYRLQRLLSFRRPFEEVTGSGWQLSMALIAVSRGEWLGVGLGNSVQKLLYLPETHTDFIFAILAEEFGLLGVSLLLVLFGLLLWRAFAVARIAERREARFAAYLAYGLAGWLALQTLINLAVNLGVAPTKGLTLPLISYGGSSLITTLAMLGLILRVDRENREAQGMPLAANDEAPP